MGMNMMENGKMTKPMDMVFIRMLAVRNMKDIGRMINKKVKAMKFGWKELNTLVNFQQVKSMAKEFCYSLMEADMKVIFLKMKFAVLENIIGKMEKYMKAIGKITK